MPVLPIRHIADVDPLAAAYTPATHRCAGNLKTMYVGKRSYIRMEECWLEYRIDYLVNYLVEVSFLDAVETTLYVALDVTRNNLTLDKAWLRECEALYHFVGQRIGILGVEPVV